MNAAVVADVSEPQTQLSRLAWLRAVMVFNLSPLCYAHSSWLPEPARTSNTSPALRRALSEAFLCELGLSSKFQWNPTSAVMQPMLLSVRSHNELALTVGVMANRNRLRQVVQRHLWERWRSLLEERLDLLWSPLADQVPQAPNERLSPCSEALETLREDGQAVLLGLLDPDEPEQAAVISRGRLRLNRSRVLDGAAWQPKVMQAEGLAESLLNDVSRGRAPWTWLS